MCLTTLSGIKIRLVQLEQLRYVSDCGNSGSVVSNGQSVHQSRVSDCGNSGSVVSNGQLEQLRCISDCGNSGILINKGQLEQ
mgnify:CR=1 FL=1